MLLRLTLLVYVWLQGTSVLTPIIPISIIITMAFVIWKKSPSHVYENHPILYILSFGMAIAKTTNKLVVCIQSCLGTVS